MATIGEINAENPKPEGKKMVEDLPLAFFFGVFFDGTSNNMVQKDRAKELKRKLQEQAKKMKQDISDYEYQLINLEKNDNESNPLEKGGNKPGDSSEKKEYSNVAILHNLYYAMNKDELQNKKKTHEVHCYNVYIEGAGTEAVWSGNVGEKIFTSPGSIAGRGHTGIVNLVSKAIFMVKTRLAGFDENRLSRKDTEIHFDLFGFSRGATCARFFAHMVSREDSDKALPCEEKFKTSIASSCYDDNEERVHFLKPISFEKRSVDFLGIFDTVSSTGGTSIDSYKANTDEYGLFSPQNKQVKNTFHIIALDEFRAHFGVTDIGEAVKQDTNGEILIPGCHSDIGGGYIDGLNEFDLVSNFNGSFFDDGKQKVWMYVEKPTNGDVDKDTMLLKDALFKLGWIEETIDTKHYPGPIEKLRLESKKTGCWHEESQSTISVKRYVWGGYCSIPLLIMKKRAEWEKLIGVSRHMFDAKELPPDYKISSIYDDWKDELTKLYKETGRKIYLPDGSYSSESYNKLRHFLHFTSKELVGFNPSYQKTKDKIIICRYLYHGDKGNSHRYYLSEIGE